ncbi:MAG: hypothetical protein FIB07_13370 [Candidatus Methanoperedens sp.]|nr:hypothetical protein [Candidatus Methanoperedens sp.]
MTRYQPIIDVLINSGVYDIVYFDHETELPIPYRNIGFLKRNALQEQSGKGRVLHKKWPDVCGISNDKLKIIIEEERKPPNNTIEEDINIISKCKYLWVDNKEFPFDPECTLFILLYNNINSIPENVIENKGNLKRIVVCDKQLFEQKYTQYV